MRVKKKKGEIAEMVRRAFTQEMVLNWLEGWLGRPSQGGRYYGCWSLG